jgi:2,5-furandicarboxylate decarboxylase 1
MAESAPVEDLRSFLQLLEDEGELARIASSVALDQEIGAVCLHNLRASGPGLLFEGPGGKDGLLAVDLLASRRRYALALGAEPDQLAAEWNHRTEHLIPPVIVESGACQQHVWVGDQVDLTRLPVPVWNERDGGAYRRCRATSAKTRKLKHVTLVFTATWCTIETHWGFSSSLTVT